MAKMENGNYRTYGWMLAAALLMPISLGLACSSVSSDSPEYQAELDAVNSAMSYIKSHHSDAAPYIADKIAFTKAAETEKPKIGFSRSTYSGAGWTVTVGYAITAELIYEISADYTGGKIKWTGISKGGVITENSYSGTGS